MSTNCAKSMLLCLTPLVQPCAFRSMIPASESCHLVLEQGLGGQTHHGQHLQHGFQPQKLATIFAAASAASRLSSLSVSASNAAAHRQTAASAPCGRPPTRPTASSRHRADRRPPSSAENRQLCATSPGRSASRNWTGQTLTAGPELTFKREPDLTSLLWAKAVEQHGARDWSRLTHSPRFGHKAITTKRNFNLAAEETGLARSHWASK